MKVYEAISHAVITEGVDAAFVLMTSDNMSLVSHLSAIGMNIVKARTEHGAVSMADGYARATGRIGLAIIGAGPSAGMTGTALLTAARKRSRVLVVAGDVPLHEHGHLKKFDQHQFLGAAAGHCLTVVSPESIVDNLTAVFRHLRVADGPAVLNCPSDVLDYGIPAVAGEYSPVVVPQGPGPGSPEVVARAVEILVASNRVVVIGGSGAVAAGASAALSKCSQLVNGLVGTTLQGSGLFGDNPWSIGVVGGLGSQASKELLATADCILVAGASMNNLTSHFGNLFPRARVIHIDNRVEAIGRTTPVEVGIVGDAKAVAEALVESLETLDLTKGAGFRTDDVRDRIAAPRSREMVYTHEAGLIDPREAVDVLERALPANRRVVIDAGHFMFFVQEGISVTHPQNRLWTADFGAVGVALSIAIGAAIAGPEIPTVVFVGDGGLMMSLPELDTAVRYNVNLVVVVLNDEGFGAEVRYLESRQLDVEPARYQSPDLDQVARGLGLESARANSVDELVDACSRISGADRVGLIDVRIDGSVAHEFLSGLTNSAASPARS